MVSASETNYIGNYFCDLDTSSLSSRNGLKVWGAAPGNGGARRDERAKRCEVGGLAKEQVERSEDEEPRCKAAQAG
jgi:hypothetical protein